MTASAVPTQIPAPKYDESLDYHALNAMLNIFDQDGQIQFEADRKAAHDYFRTHVNTNMVWYHDLEEKIDHLISEDLYDKSVFDMYEWGFVKSLYKRAYEHEFRFPTFVAAYKFYTSYAMRTNDGKRYYERYEDRVAICALFLAQGDEVLAAKLVDDMILGRFQPATPTFLNAGKAQRGELVSCYLLRTEDNMESISRNITNALQLSKRGGGVALNLTNLRHSGAPIKGIENQSSGIIPVMKLLEDSFSYSNQLGQRPGAGAVYLNAHHPDIYKFLDTKRENADEKIRIKTLSLGIVVPDITFELAKRNEDMYLFSPYDVERVYGKAFSDISVTEKYYEMVDDARISKTKINPREFFTTISEIQFESGYPYLMFEDTANKASALPGRITHSNLCVTGDTQILTSDGYRKVLDLYESQEDFDVIVDTRARDMDMSKPGVSVEKSTRMAKTAQDAQILKVTTSGGHTLRATEWHKMYVLRSGNLVKIPLGEVIPESDELLLNLSQGLDNPIQDSTRVDAVVSIEADGIEDVYDVTVENGNSVIFNGIATGNCSEILQVSTPSTFTEEGYYDELGHDISCNLGSLNIAKAMDSGDLGSVVNTAVRALTAVSDTSNIKSAPSIHAGNQAKHAIGLGQMNLHGYLGRECIHYGSPEALEFVSAYFAAVAYYAIQASMNIARERGETFYDFEDSKYADGSYFDKYVTKDWRPTSPEVHRLFSFELPTPEDWVQLRADVAEHGMYNAYLQAVPPTGSISYINNATSSIHPVVAQIEVRKEGGASGVGRVYVPQYGLRNDNRDYFTDAYELGPEAVIDTYAAAQEHVDQGLSCTLFFRDTATTRDINKAQIYAWRKGLKTLYYIRIRQMALEGTEAEMCVSCSL